LDVINRHTLSSFRVSQKNALDDLFAQMLAPLEKAELPNLERVMLGRKPKQMVADGGFTQRWQHGGEKD